MRSNIDKQIDAAVMKAYQTISQTGYLITGEQVIALAVNNGFVTPQVSQILAKYLEHLPGEASLFEMLKEFIPECLHRDVKDLAQKAFGDKPLKVFYTQELLNGIKPFFSKSSWNKFRTIIIEQKISDEVFKEYLKFIPQCDHEMALCEIFGNKVNWPDWTKDYINET